MMTEIELRGTKNAKGKAGTGKKLIQGAIKTVASIYAGGAAGLGAGSGAAGGATAAGGGAGSFGGAGAIGGGAAVPSQILPTNMPLEIADVAKDLSAPQSSVMDAFSGGASGVKGYITDKTGIPTSAGDVVGQVGGKLGIQPEYINSVQDVLANRGPKQDPLQASQNFPQQQKQSSYQNVYQNSRVGKGASGQSGVMGMVNQRFGKDSQIAGYLGAYQEGGSVLIPETEGSADKTYLIDVGGGERVTVTPADGQVNASAADLRSQNRAIIYDDRGNRSYASEEHGSQIKGTDLMRPHQQRATGLDKAFGWFGAIGSKGTGASPGQRIQGSEDWRQARAIMDEVTRFRRQLGDEQRAPTYDEQIGVDRLLNSIGQPSLYGIMPGSERERPTGQINERGQPTSLIERLGATEAGGLGFTPFGDPFAKGAPRPNPTRKIGVDPDATGNATGTQTQSQNWVTGEWENVGDPQAILKGISAPALAAQEANAANVGLWVESMDSMLDELEAAESDTTTYQALFARSKTSYNELRRLLMSATNVGMNAQQSKTFELLRKRMAKFATREVSDQLFENEGTRPKNEGTRRKKPGVSVEPLANSPGRTSSREANKRQTGSEAAEYRGKPKSRYGSRRGAGRPRE